MSKKLDRIWVEPSVKKKIKIGAAEMGCTIGDFVKKKVIDDKPLDILEDMHTDKKRRKRGGFDFPF